jgi:hypothetical protein
MPLSGTPRSMQSQAIDNCKFPFAEPELQMAYGLRPQYGQLLMTPAPQDRRTARRYPVNLKVACRLVMQGVSVYVGAGTTRNMSSKGMLIELDQQLNTGDVVEALIRWPAGHQIMHVLGNVVRSDSHGTAMEIVHHKFAERSNVPRTSMRTRRKHQESL